MWRPAGEERGSADHHHRIDLERSALGQRRNLDGGTRRVRLAEVFGHHRVDLGELAQVGQVQADARHVVERTAAASQTAPGLSNARRACAAVSPATSSPVARSTGIWQDVERSEGENTGIQSIMRNKY